MGAIVNRKVLFLTLIAAGVMRALSAQAVTVAPATYSIQFENVPNAVNVLGATSPQSATYIFFGGTLNVSADAATIVQPAVSAGIGSGGCTSGFPGSGCAGSFYGSTATLTYQIAASGPAGVMVPYNFDTAGSVTILGSFANGSASVTLTPPGGIGLTGFIASTTASTGLTNTTITCGAACVVGTQHVFLLSDTAYTVQIRASAGAATNFNAVVNADADPYIYIDPTFARAGEFSLLISDGIGNAPLASTPIPTALPMFASGVGALGLLGWRRKKKAPQITA